MGVTATTRLPAGWYPDPDGGERRRWWDGQEWTQYTADFQRHTSVDELELEPETAPTAKPGKSAKGTKPAKVARKLRRVEDEVPANDTPAAPEDDSVKPMRATADRLGRWLAGAVHFRTSVKKHRGAHRSNR